MTQEEKDLLIKDLCARLPYGVKGIITYNGDKNIFTVKGVFNILFLSDTECCRVEDFKPYLFPLSSMTEEQDKEFALLQTSAGKEGFFLYAWNCANMVKWLIENNFDYNGLIEKGLAIDATGLNIY